MGIILSNGSVRAYSFHASHEGFYIADGTIAINLIVLSCFFFCDDDCHQGGNQALARESIPSSLHGLGNHTKQNPLIGAISWLSSKSLELCS